MTSPTSIEFEIELTPPPSYSHYNRLRPVEDEALAHFNEECAEAIVAVSKIMRFGLEGANPDDTALVPLNNRQALAEEVGNILAAINLLQKASLVFPAEIEESRKRKLQKVKRYLHHLELP